ncbi:hypothetical protein OSB04_013843 [Centaurea solstitialis]|uniref:Purple acid phosphatase C-terminal domain-containing protein n=1 Tax=Centaurea solstitialis TaxID=347529 RepID=A0AA38TE19_9ASTR|nr:hypothetical protein OSB04_013843 [Centaurea solstitialis]
MRFQKLWLVVVAAVAAAGMTDVVRSYERPPPRETFVVSVSEEFILPLHNRGDTVIGMMESMEGLLYRARVDVIFAGHVHAYERFDRVYNQETDNCAPMHITIGDGGNRGHPGNKYKEPQPKISLFREASFGHGEFDVVNASHALWSWHRNDDDEAVRSDSIWLRNLASDPACIN